MHAYAVNKAVPCFVHELKEELLQQCIDEHIFSEKRKDQLLSVKQDYDIQGINLVVVLVVVPFHVKNLAMSRIQYFYVYEKRHPPL